MGTIEDAYSTGYEDGFAAAMEQKEALSVTKYDNCGNKSATWRCPRCFEAVNATWNDIGYCQYCGQKIKYNFRGVRDGD